MSELNNRLVDDLIKAGHLKTPHIIEAFKKVDRFDFVIEYLKNDAYANNSLGIGFGQTISQPLTVAFMLELLQPQEGNKILDIGFGSGWQMALLCEIVGTRGKVFGIEIIPELYQFGKKNINRYEQKGIAEVILGDGSHGFAAKAPFDKIISATAPEALLEEWKKQLKIGGQIVWPMKNSLWLGTKKTENDFEMKEFPGFDFVPMIKK
ncbi:MAG TPA: protein-L-isoaspartate O-methyltransferase [Candidatus Paceibacterota bacterium]|nr:protein-L-isoaspartate O-methyltransferase [Candidatus Paceibacterota bacterium]HPT40535.1 protein-L-isoaspartate O-methyltransferase [Candidatus Paceibacterota bacterium]